MLGKIKEIYCVLVGHSKIQTTCFGYVHCARCEAQIGDRLGSIFDMTDSVIVGHNCDRCQENYKKLLFSKKFLCPNPFKEPK